MSKPISDAQIFGLLWAESSANGTLSELHRVPCMVKAPDGRTIMLSRTSFDSVGLLGLGRRGLMLDRGSGLWGITDVGRSELRKPTIAKRIVAMADSTVAEPQRSRGRQGPPSATLRKPRTMIYDADFRRDSMSKLSCWACQRGLRPRHLYREVFLVDGCEILHPDDVSLASELRGVLAWVPVGPDCARKIGLEWTREVKP